MTKNFEFCNENFLDFYYHEPWRFYNQFYLEDSTRSLIDSMGDHPDFHLVFKYNAEKRIRATFIVFDDKELKDMDVKCICVLFHGDSRDNYCYFYEVYEDSTIGCVQVAHQLDSKRIVLGMDVGTDIDAYFDKLCSRLGQSTYESTTMLYHRDGEDDFRLLDIILSELPKRCVPLLGGSPVMERKNINNVDFLVYKSKWDNTFLASRTIDGKNPTDILLSDIEILSSAIKNGKWLS